MAAEKTRVHIQAQGDFYLCPLSTLHVPPTTLVQNVETYLAAGSPLIQAMGEGETGQPKCLAQGYETLVEMSVNEGDQTICWQERRLIIQSIDASLAAQSSLHERLEKAEMAIGELMVRKQGKRDEYLVERNFGRLKGHPLSLGPVYLQRDDHCVDLIRLLTIALRVVTVLEGSRAFRSGEASPGDCGTVCRQSQTPDGSAYLGAVAGSLQ